MHWEERALRGAARTRSRRPLTGGAGRLSAEGDRSGTMSNNTYSFSKWGLGIMIVMIIRII